MVIVIASISLTIGVAFLAFGAWMVQLPLHSLDLAVVSIRSQLEPASFLNKQVKLELIEEVRRVVPLRVVPHRVVPHRVVPH